MLCGCLSAAVAEADAPANPAVDTDLAARFARLALDCVHREYPNKIAHVLNSAADAKPPSQLYPVFYGCFDWHSAVHGHWLLVRLLRTTAGAGLPQGLAEEIEQALNRSFTPQGAASEVAYLQGENRGSFERPYGMAWFLQLTSELREWDDPRARSWLETLLPLERELVGLISSWLPKLAYPIRLGTHNQSMFAFTLMLDWARTAGNSEMEALLVELSPSGPAPDSVADDPGKARVVGIAIGRVTVGDENADHLASFHLVGDGVTGDTTKRALDTGAVSTAESFVADPLHEGAISRDGQRGLLDLGIDVV